MVKHISITDIINSDKAVFSENGKLVYKEIFNVIEEGDVVELDFYGIELLTTAFLNAAIGQLYSHYDSATLNLHLKLINVAEEDKYLFKRVLDRAKEYFANKESFGNSAKDAICGE